MCLKQRINKFKDILFKITKRKINFHVVNSARFKRRHLFLFMLTALSRFVLKIKSWNWVFGFSLLSYFNQIWRRAQCRLLHEIYNQTEMFLVKIIHHRIHISCPYFRFKFLVRNIILMYQSKSDKCCRISYLSLRHFHSSECFSCNSLNAFLQCFKKLN